MVLPPLGDMHLQISLLVRNFSWDGCNSWETWVFSQGSLSPPRLSPSGGRFWLFHRWWCSERAGAEVTRPLEAAAQIAERHPAAFHWSEQAAVAEGLRLTGRAAKNLLSPTTQFQHVHHPEANTVQHAVCSAYVKRTHRKFIKQEIWCWDFPGGSGPRESTLQCRGSQFDPWWGTKISHATGQLNPCTTVKILCAATLTRCSQINEWMWKKTDAVLSLPQESDT